MGDRNSVAMSNIPAFKEHIKYLGVIAQIFDPLDAVIKNIEFWNIKKISKRKLLKFPETEWKISWDLIIKQYINFIKQ